MTGLYGKYKIEKTDGSPIDPKALYFVLRLDTDKSARRALRAYALLQSTEFYVDIMKCLLSIDPNMVEDLAAYEFDLLGIEKIKDLKLDAILAKN